MTRSKAAANSISSEPASLENLRSRSEELANALTHGAGLALSLIGLGALLVMAILYGDAAHIVSCVVYGTTLVVLYAASTLYHSASSARWRFFFRVFDHIAILFLIAGTYTPFALVLLGGSAGWVLFGLAWAFALVGTVYKLVSRRRFGQLFTIFYVGMGWLAVTFAKPILVSVPSGAIVWLAVGGLCYTAGVVFYAWDRLPYNHAIWHLFVLAGSACHYVAVLRYVALGPVS